MIDAVEIELGRDELALEHFFESDIVLENHRVKLAPFSAAYEDEIATLLMDEEITRYTQQHITNRDDAANYVKRAMQGRIDRLAYPFIVIDKRDNKAAGSTRLGNINFSNKRLEIGWTWYGKAYRGTGINEACKFELLNYAFETMGFNRVQFSVDAENVRSQRAVVKLGAIQEGIFRHNYMNALGECRDDIYFSIIRTEWPEIKRLKFRDYEV